MYFNIISHERCNPCAGKYQVLVAVSVGRVKSMLMLLSCGRNEKPSSSSRTPSNLPRTLNSGRLPPQIVSPDDHTPEQVVFCFVTAFTLASS